MAQNLPGDGFLGWLGRQIGHVTKAVKTDAKAPPAPAALPPAPPPPAAPPPAGAAPLVVYREEKVEEVEHPGRPGVLLRRTVIDEAIVDPTRAKTDAPQ